MAKSKLTGDEAARYERYLGASNPDGKRQLFEPLPAPEWVKRFRSAQQRIQKHADAQTASTK